MDVSLRYTAVPQNVKAWKVIKNFLSEYEYELSVLDVNDSPASPDASVTVELYTVDFSGDTLKRFIDVLGYLSNLAFKCTDHDTIIMKMTIDGLWKAVEPRE